MYIHPNRMGAIRDSEVRQLFLMPSHEGLNLEVVKTIFFNLDFIYFIHSLHRRFVIFLFITKLAEVPGVACGILKIEFIKKRIIKFAYVIPKGIH